VVFIDEAFDWEGNYFRLLFGLLFLLGFFLAGSTFFGFFDHFLRGLVA
jgi:hypothetical protein